MNILNILMSLVADHILGMAVSSQRSFLANFNRHLDRPVLASQRRTGSPSA